MSVPGPTAQMRGPASARRSCASASTWPTNAATAFVLVKTIQSNDRTPAAARSSGPGSAGGPMRSTGASTASAPFSSSSSTRSGAWFRERVTSTRRPNSGRLSNQRRCSRNPTTGPITRTPGAVTSRSWTRATISASGAVIVRCDDSRAVLHEAPSVSRPRGRAPAAIRPCAASAAARCSRQSCLRAGRGCSQSTTAASRPSSSKPRTNVTVSPPPG